MTRPFSNFIMKSASSCFRNLRSVLKDPNHIANLQRRTRFIHSFTNKAKLSLENQWTDKFKEADIPDPEYSVKWISEHVQRMVETKKFSDMDTRQEVIFQTEFVRLCKRRLKREPVQYVIGDWDFRFLNLLMRLPVFIPRPETEGLVDLINQHLKSNFEHSLCCNIFEIGCGTGAISLSLAFENAMVRCTAIDIFEDAVSLAKDNCERLGLSSRVNIHHSNIGSVNQILKGEKFDVIVSNPPYIPTKDMRNLQPEVARFEDHRALHGGESGLDIIHEILTMAKEILNPDGTVWLEVDTTHPPLIKEIVETIYQDQICYMKTHMDVYDRPRFCQLKYSPL